MVAGALLGLLGLTLAGLATAAAWAAVQQRDGGFITAPTHRYAVNSYALTTTDLDVLIDDDLPAAARPDAARVVVRATPADPAKPVFVGIAPAAEVAAYLQRRGAQRAGQRQIRSVPGHLPGHPRARGRLRLPAAKPSGRCRQKAPAPSRPRPRSGPGTGPSS